jgi:hypothetical protein
MGTKWVPLMQQAVGGNHFSLERWAADSSKDKRQAGSFFIGRIRQHRHGFRRRELRQPPAAQLELVIQEDRGQFKAARVPREPDSNTARGRGSHSVDAPRRAKY